MSSRLLRTNAMGDSCQTVYWSLDRHHPQPLPHVILFTWHGNLPYLVALNLYLFLSTSVCGMQKKKLSYNTSFHSLDRKNCPKPASRIYFSLKLENKTLNTCYILIFLFIWAKMEVQVLKKYLSLPNPDVSESFSNIFFFFFSYFYI